MPVKRACAIMKVSTSGYYEWLCGEESPRQLRDRIRAQHIKEIFHKHKGNYGARRIQAELARERNIHMSRRKISSLMVQNGLCSNAHRRKRMNTTDSRHNMLISDNLLKRQFDQSMPNKAWVTDTTYIRTMEGWLYLTVIIDLYSRRVVGWAMSEKIDADLAVAALKDALRARKPAAGLIVHSDRGSQFASNKFRDALTEADAFPSMSAKGSCYDNACAESFFHSLKVERVYTVNVYATREQAKADILGYLLYYDRTRIHSHLGYLSPYAFENLSILEHPFDPAA